MLWVLLAAVAGGVSVLLQAQSARAEGHPGHLGLLATLVRRPRYIAGLACMFVGFLSAALALRHLPLFAVQAGRASSLAVTAVLAVFVLRAKLRPRDIVAVTGVGLGLVALAVASRPGRAEMQLEHLARWAPLVGVLALLALGQWVSRRTEPWVGPVVGAAAGTSFTVVGLCVRAIMSLRGPDVLAHAFTEPLLYTLPVAGFTGIHLSTIALTRASVVSVTSAILAAETIVATVLGFTLAGDRARHGMTLVALLGVGLVLAGALDLARFGHELEAVESEPEESTDVA